jgi:membrane associated rhomboid family serine protease
MFMHAGLMHLAGNMLFLWIFGNNIEDELGKIRFITFYLLCGVIAALGHVFMDTGSEIPMVGASGAISGVLGAYLMLFPKAKVKTLVFLGILITIVRIPAAFLLIFWLGIQIYSNMASGNVGGGVAWMAHIGGFAAGMILILPFKASLKPSRPRPRVL